LTLQLTIPEGPLALCLTDAGMETVESLIPKMVERHIESTAPKSVPLFEATLEPLKVIAGFYTERPWRIKSTDNGSAYEDARCDQRVTYRSFVCQVADINASRPSPRRRFIAEKNILRVMTRLRRGGCIKGREVDPINPSCLTSECHIAD
jgi:hypothetical protein